MTRTVVSHVRRKALRRSRCSSRNVGVAIGLVAGAPCRRTSPEECTRPTVVSLVCSLVSECLWAVPEGSERMVFRVGRWGSRLLAPRETWECR